MPKAQNLYYYMDEDYFTVNRIYGLLSKSYDPFGEHIEVLVQSNSSANCAQIGGRGTNETGSFKTQSVDGSDRSMNCRLSGEWRATTAVWANNTELPNIGEMYDTQDKDSYSGARATVTTSAGNKFMFLPMVLLDIKLMQMVLMMVHQKKILFIMQFNQKIPLIIEFQI